MKKSNLMPSVILGTICITVALLLALVNMITGPIIEQRQNEAANAALLEVLPEGKNFEEIEITDSYPTVITAGYKAEGGFVFRASVTGKSSGLVIMCGINSEGKVVATKVIADQETDSYDAKVFPLLEGTDGKYKDMDLTGFEPYLVSGATLTSKAYGEAIKASLQSFIIANGGEVDTRTPEQILQDNCNAALGTTNIEFTKWIGASLTLGCEIYIPSDESGTVFKIGDTFIGYDASGNEKENSAASEEKTTAANAYLIYSTAEKIDLTKHAEVNTDLVKEVWLLADGNYVLKLEARGYGTEATGKYSNKSGKRIFIEISIDSDGKIISCVTTAQYETSIPASGMGTVCADPDYYKQYNDKTYENITDDFAQIAGSTITSEGYRNAVKAAINAVLTIEGGNQ